LASILFFPVNSLYAQPQEELTVSIDADAKAIPLPGIFKPNLDLSGRGARYQLAWPQSLAAKEKLDLWKKDIGFSGFYRIQYNLWEITQLEKEAQPEFLANIEAVIKSVNDAGGVVILDLFGTPPGMGRILDKNSAPLNLEAFKELVKDAMRRLSCEKKYNIWYEAWNSPDLGDFFLGKRQEYFELYRVVAEAAKELRAETGTKIIIGGPGASAWFQNLGSNTVFTPERSLIYELIKYCYSYRLPLDFISWHGYSSDPLLDCQGTIYGKNPQGLIREWLGYFHFDSSTPLIVDEWNFDRDMNMAAERAEKSYIGASYIPSRLESMYRSGLDNQVYFCLEDFQNNKEGVKRNPGVFSFENAKAAGKSRAKAAYNIFKMLSLLGNSLLEVKLEDNFAGVIPTKSRDYLVLLIYNYIDPDSSLNYLSRNIIYLNDSERQALLNIIKSERLERILAGALSLSELHISNRLKGFFASAIEIGDTAKKYSALSRKLKLSIKGLQGAYLYSRYEVSSGCSYDCAFTPAEEKEINFDKVYEGQLELAPYSVQLLVFKKKPAEAQAVPAAAVAGEPKKNAEGK